MSSQTVAEAAGTDREYAHQEIDHGLNPRRIGDVVMEVKNITQRFGGVTAIKDVSFDILEGEVRAIIGPNGAGKSSMLNVINGFYHPQEGEVWFHGKKLGNLKPHQIARQGIARTFQNIALFHGMSTLDNIMTGRLTKMHRNIFWQALWSGPAEREEIAHREKVEQVIDFLEIQAIRKTPVGRLPYGLQKRVEVGRAPAADAVLPPLPVFGVAVFAVLAFLAVRCAAAYLRLRQFGGPRWTGVSNWPHSVAMLQNRCHEWYEEANRKYGQPCPAGPPCFSHFHRSGSHIFAFKLLDSSNV